ncbi:dienelactone hydrolase family protein [Halochromatium roseum]|uniref:dienelactone hydrolase family protein n=1 Tax=Halochromatium roseum TaxID=391920 RepID=UPI0019121B61|nr:alpha/beta hydrolase [Halochromatium roseum]MBK5940174.1 hydrolase [Halochromatium roseum]
MSPRETIDVEVPIEGGNLPGFLHLPRHPAGLVLFAHGSGSSRFSRRNQAVAEVLYRGRMATLLFDLLTPGEHEIDQRTAELRFDIPLLIERLVAAIDWAVADQRTAGVPIGLFGASTGAAAALGAAVRRPRWVRVVVSRGGRPDLADEDLPRVEQPTLLIVGSLDPVVLEVNRDAARRMGTEPRLEIVSGASHLFEEAGKLESVSMLARDWFLEHFELS